jgi:anti-anti-sigma factor
MGNHLSFKVFHAPAEPRGSGRGARTVIRVAGEIDVATSALLAASITGAMKLAEAGAPDIAVDLARVSFIDASGINVLLSAASRVRGTGGSLVLRSPSRAVLRMLRVLSLNGTLMVE